MSLTPKSRDAVIRTMNATEWGMLLALSVLWGGSFFFVGVAVGEVPAFTLVFLRLAIAAVILNVVVLALGERMPRDSGVWLAFAGMGVLNNVVPFSLIVWGQSHIASGLAAILNATTPLFTVVVAHALTGDDKITVNRAVGLFAGLLGVVLMVGPNALDGFGADVAVQIAVLAAALSYAFAGVYGRRFSRMGVRPMLTATGQVTASTVILLPIMLVVDTPWLLPAPSLQAWGAIAGVAALSTALAYVLYFRLLSTAGATNLLLVTFLIPVSAILLGSLFLGERLHAIHFVGMVSIGAGLAAIDGRILAFRRWTRPALDGAQPPTNSRDS